MQCIAVVTFSIFRFFSALFQLFCFPGSEIRPPERTDIVLWYGEVYFNILNRLGVTHDCNRQTDRRTDGETDEQTLSYKMQRFTFSVLRWRGQKAKCHCYCLLIFWNCSNGDLDFFVVERCGFYRKLFLFRFLRLSIEVLIYGNYYRVCNGVRGLGRRLGCTVS